MIDYFNIFRQFINDTPIVIWRIMVISCLVLILSFIIFLGWFDDRSYYD